MISRQTWILVLSYVLFALAFSTIGLIMYAHGGQPEEYTLSSFLIEIGGHFLFGAIAAIPFLDAELILLTGALAVLIDADHILRVLSVPIGQRPDHSILFMVLSALLLYYVARRMNLSRSYQVKILFVTPVAILSHFSYDIFAAFEVFNGGNSFPLFAPFNLSMLQFPLWSFPIFEIVAMLLALIGTVFSKHWETTRLNGTRYAMKRAD